MIRGQVLEEGLVGGKAEAAAQALADLLQHRVRPMADLAAVWARHMLEVASDHQPACSAFGANDIAADLELADQADVGTREMMQQAVVADPARATASAPGTKCRQSPTLRTQLDSIGDLGPKNSVGSPFP